MSRPKKHPRSASPARGPAGAAATGGALQPPRSGLAESIAAALRTAPRPRGPAGVVPRTGAAVAAAVAIAAFHPAGMANPEGGTVVAGSATIDPTSPSRLDINQTSGKAIIDWRRFDIGAGEHTNFNQPSSSSITLTRVGGPGASAIDGRLTANGNVFIVNPQGVVFGRGAEVSVSGLVATTSDIDNEDFMRGRYEFSKPSSDPGANVTNRGRIEVDEGGNVVLAGPSVHNDGEIVARLGKVTLAGGTRFTVDMNGDGLLSFDVGGEVNSAPLDADGNAADAVVTNAGRIAADGGIVTLSASARDAVVDRVINMSGVIEATAVEVRGGKVVLSGGDSGTVAVSGTIDASGAGPGQGGGEVEVLGHQVGLYAGADISVDGGAGGGTALVGGSFQGAGPQPSARATYVSGGASVHADALADGDGGTVVAWSDEVTRAHGTLSARGGPSGGNGGMVETSSKGVLDVAGIDVRANAPGGAAGEWLLDPGSIRIIDDGPSTTPSVLDPESGELVFTSPVPGFDSFIEARQIELQLGRGTDVRVVAVRGAIDGGEGFSPGNILVNANIDKTTGGDTSLTFIADGNIIVNNNITSASGALNLSFRAGRVIDIEGPQVVGGNVNLNGSIDLSGASTSTVLVQANRSISVDGGEGSAANIRSTAAPMNLTMQAAENIAFTIASVQTNGGTLHLEANSPHLGIPSAGRAGLVSTVNAPFTTTGGATTLIGSGFEIGSSAINAGNGNVNFAYTTTDQTVTLGGTQAQDPGRLQSSEIAQLLTDGTITFGVATTAGTDGSGTAAQELQANAWSVQGFNLTAGTTSIVATNGVTITANVSQAANSPGAATRNLALQAGTDILFTGANGSFPGVSTLGGAFTAQASAGSVQRPGAMTTSGGRVFLFAGTDVNTAAAATNTGGGSFTAQAGRNIQLLGPVTTLSGSFDLIAGLDINTVNAEISTGGAAVVARASRNVLVNGAVDSGGGNITIIADEGRSGGVANLQGAFQSTPGSLTSGGGAVSVSGERVVVDGGEGAGSAAFINAGGGAITLAAASNPATQTVSDVVLGGNVSSTAGALFVNAGLTGNVTIGGAPPANPAEPTIDSADFANLGRDFASLELGVANGSGRITLQDVSFPYGVTARANGTGGSVRILGDVSTQGPFLVEGSGATFVLNGNVVTAGQPITINDSVDLQGNSSLRTTGNIGETGQPVTAGANISVTGGISVDGGEGQGPFDLTFDAGTGGAVSGQAVSGVDALAVTAGNGVTFTGAVSSATFGASVLGGNIDVANTLNDFTGAVTVQKTGAGTTRLADANALQLNASSFGSGAATILAGSLSFAGTVSGTGTLALEPLTASSDLAIGSALTANLAQQFSEITIGVAGGSGTITMQGATFAAPLTLRADGAGGRIAINGDLKSTGPVSIIGPPQTGQGSPAGLGTTLLNGNIVTAGQAIDISDAVELQAGAQLSTTGDGEVGAVPAGANITITGAVSSGTGGPFTLDFDAGTSGVVSAQSSLAGVSNLTVTGSAGATFTGPVQVANFTATAAGGNVEAGNAANDFTGTVTVRHTGAGSVQLADANTLALAASTFGSGGGTVTAQTTSIDGTLSSAGPVTIQGAGTTTLLNADVVTAGQAISINDSVQVGTNARIATTGGGEVSAAPAGAGITITGAVSNAVGSGPFTLTFDAGTTGQVLAQGSVSGLAGVVVASSAGASFAGPVQVGTFTVTAAGGNVEAGNTANDFTGSVTVRHTGAGGVQLADANTLALAASNFGTGGGTITAVDTIINGTLGSTGPVTIQGGGTTTTLNANIVTANAAIEIRDSVLVGTNAQLSTTSLGDSTTGAGVTITGAISSGAGGPFTLTFDAGTTGQVLAQGGVSGLAGVTVTNSAGASFTGPVQVGTFAVSAAGGSVQAGNAANDFTGAVTVQKAGTGSVEIADANTLQFGASDFGSGDATLRAGGVALAGALAGSGGLTFEPVDAASTIALDQSSAFANLGQTFSSITVGRQDNAGTVSVTDVAFAGPLTLRGSRIVVGGTLRNTGSVTIEGTGTTTELGGNIVTAGQPIVIRDAVALQLDSLLSTTGDDAVGVRPDGADITVAGAVSYTGASSPPALSLSAGTTGQVSAQSSVTGLSAVNVLGSAGALFSGPATIETFNITASGGDVVATNAANDFTGAVSFRHSGSGGVRVIDANTLQLEASTLGSGASTFTAADTIVNGTLRSNGPVTIQGSTGDTTTLNGSIVTAGQPITINDSLNVPGTPTLDTTLTGDRSAGASIAVSGAVNGPGTLNVLAGSGDVTFSGAVGSAERLASMNIGSAGNVRFDGRLLADAGSVTHTGTFIANTEDALDVGDLFVNPAAEGATLAGTVNGASGEDAALQVRGPVGDERFTINSCVIGVRCGVPDVLPPVVEPDTTPVEPRQPAGGEESAPQRSLPGVSLTRLEQRYGLPEDPRDGQFSNFGNEELWLEPDEGEEQGDGEEQGADPQATRQEGSG